MTTLQTYLIALVKDPAQVPAKTRLAATLGTHEARQFYEACLDTLATQLERLQSQHGWKPVVCHTPDEISPSLAARFGKVQFEPQSQGNLGERLCSIDARVRSLGAQRCLFMGSDSPDLADAHLVHLTGLCQGQAALIPAHDGGFVALASDIPLPSLAHVRWSSPGTLQDVRAILQNAGIVTSLAEPWSDVDDERDLWQLTERLKNQASPHLKPLLDLCNRMAPSRVPKAP